MRYILIILTAFFVVSLSACDDGGKATEKDFKEYGKKVFGVIKSKYTKKFQTLDGMKRDYYIRYGFKPKGESEELVTSYKVPKEIYKVTQKGEKIEVEYIKDSPKKSRLTLSEFR